MNIGIIGPGRMGSTLGRLWAGVGHHVYLGSRDPAKAQTLAVSLQLQGRAGQLRGGSIQEAAAFGEVVLIATVWAGVADALAATGPLAGKVLIDCTLPLIDRELAIAADSSGAQEIAKLVPEARVVKAFNTMDYEQFAHPIINGQAISLFYCGDDAAAKATVAQLGAELGLDPVDAGPLFVAHFLEGMSYVWIFMSVVSGYGKGIGFKVLRSTPAAT